MLQENKTPAKSAADIRKEMAEKKRAELAAKGKVCTYFFRLSLGDRMEEWRTRPFWP